MARPLLELLADLPDPRGRHGRHGRQYPLGALLGLTLVAVLAGQTSLAAIAQSGRLRGHRLGHALGFTSGKMPCANTLAELFRTLDAGRHGGGWEHVAIDGKVLRGSRDGAAPGVHLLAAYAPQAAAVTAQMAVGATTNEHKAALRLLGALAPLRGAVVTAGRDVHARRLRRESAGEAGRVHPLREGQPARPARRHRRRLRRRRGRGLFPPSGSRSGTATPRRRRPRAGATGGPRPAPSPRVPGSVSTAPTGRGWRKCSG